MIYKTLHKFSLSHYLSKKIFTEKFFFFRVTYYFFKKINWEKKIKKNGIEYTVYLKNGVGFMNFISDYEGWLETVIPKLLKKSGGVFIDVGANTGQTLLKVIPFFPSIKYYAIEPNTNCVEYLNTLCAMNSFHNVRILNYALSNKEGDCKLHLRYKDDLLATTTPSFRQFTKYALETTVPMLTGEKLFAMQNINDVSIIKIDVEGGESDIIEGLLNSIKLYKPFIICEILPLKSKSEQVFEFRKNSANKIISEILDINYAICNILDKTDVKSIDDLSSSLESCNYLFYPKNQMNPLAS